MSTNLNNLYKKTFGQESELPISRTFYSRFPMPSNTSRKCYWCIHQRIMKTPLIPNAGKFLLFCFGDWRFWGILHNLFFFRFLESYFCIYCNSRTHRDYLFHYFVYCLISSNFSFTFTASFDQGLGYIVTRSFIRARKQMKWRTYVRT